MKGLILWAHYDVFFFAFGYGFYLCRICFYLFFTLYTLVYT
jgi:hypothetical protein